MISLKPLRILILATSGLVAVSCQQNTPEAGVVIKSGPDLAKIRAQNAAQAKAEAKAKSIAETKAKKMAEQQREIQENAKKRQAEIASTRTIFKAPSWREPIAPKPVVKKPKYRLAKPVPNRPGFVFNPYTYDQVDVRGYRGRSVVIDPNDPAGRAHAFQLP